MNFLRDINNLNFNTGSVVAVGSFDGVHLGHQKLLQEVVSRAQKLGLKSVVVTFEPHPKEYFSRSFVRLTTWSEKLLMFKTLGIEQVICLRFNEALASLTANDFIRKILVEKLKAKLVIVGDDFCFGCKKSGDAKFLVEHAGRDFAVEVVPDFTVDGMVVKSTVIKNALAEDDLVKASKLLGKLYSIIGRVVHGDKRGRQLGFPTANIFLPPKFSPLHGTYAARVAVDGTWFLSVANIGFRPTVRGQHQRLLELHLLDFNRDIYGKRIQAEFMHKLREEKKFANLDLLKRQITEDIKQVRLTSSR